ncbi:hypothetical protein PKCBPO_00770 [Methylorubrum thiocyanatum]
MLHSLTLNAVSGIGQSYRILAPLDEDGCLDVKEWLRDRDACIVSLLSSGGAARAGHLALTIDASGGLMWFILYGDRVEDEPCQRIAGPRFRDGDKVAVRDPVSGAMHAFEVSADRGCATSRPTEGMVAPRPGCWAWARTSRAGAEESPRTAR